MFVRVHVRILNRSACHFNVIVAKKPPQRIPGRAPHASMCWRNAAEYRLLMRDSIEQKIRLLQKQKAALMDDVLGEERFAQSLTLDDLRFLFAE